MEKKTKPAQPAKTKTQVNKTAARKAADSHAAPDAQRATRPDGKVPVVKDIDEGSPERK